MQPHHTVIYVLTYTCNIPTNVLFNLIEKTSFGFYIEKEVLFKQDNYKLIFSFIKIKLLHTFDKAEISLTWTIVIILFVYLLLTFLFSLKNHQFILWNGIGITYELVFNVIWNSEIRLQLALTLNYLAIRFEY